jgi:hypothetical protein
LYAGSYSRLVAQVGARAGRCVCRRRGRARIPAPSWKAIPLNGLTPGTFVQLGVTGAGVGRVQREAVATSGVTGVPQGRRLRNTARNSLAARGRARRNSSGAGHQPRPGRHVAGPARPSGRRRLRGRRAVAGLAPPRAAGGGRGPGGADICPAALHQRLRRPRARTWRTEAVPKTSAPTLWSIRPTGDCTLVGVDDNGKLLRGDASGRTLMVAVRVR